MNHGYTNQIALYTRQKNILGLLRLSIIKWYMTLLQTAINDIVAKNIGGNPPRKVLIYDLRSWLSVAISEAYRIALWPDAQSYDFDRMEIDSLNFRDILIELPTGSLVVMVQSTNFRITDFRVRVELSQHGIHCIEHNHLGYLPKEHYQTYFDSLKYRTPDYVRCTDMLNKISAGKSGMDLVDKSGIRLHFGPLEKFRGNTGDYPQNGVKWGTYPVGEAFSEAVDLESVHGSFRLYAYPDENFQVVFCEPFEVHVEKGRIIHNDDHPAGFLWLMNMIREHENGEVMIRELGIGMNPEISIDKPMSDVNAFERILGVHLSLGKKHGIFGKKLPKTDIQKYHIDVFLDTEHLDFSGKMVRFDREKLLVTE